MPKQNPAPAPSKLVETPAKPHPSCTDVGSDPGASRANYVFQSDRERCSDIGDSSVREVEEDIMSDVTPVGRAVDSSKTLTFDETEDLPVSSPLVSQRDQNLLEMETLLGSLPGDQPDAPSVDASSEPVEETAVEPGLEGLSCRDHLTGTEKIADQADIEMARKRKTEG